MRILKHLQKYELAPILSLILVCLFPCVFVYTQNVESAAFTDTLGVFAFYLVVATAVTLVTLIFFRNFSRAALFADAVMLVVVNFTMASDALQKHMSWYSPVYLAAIVIVLLMLLLILLIRKKPDLRIACTLIAIAFASVTMMNLIMAVPTIVRSRQSSESTVLTGQQNVTENSTVVETVPEETPWGSVPPTAAAVASTEVSSNEENDGSAEESSAVGESAMKNTEIAEEPSARPEVAENIFTAAEKPNVYYLIFDEYGGYENLLHYFNYDNMAFLDELKERGFNVALESRNTDGVYTNSLMPNIMNLNYVMTGDQIKDEDLTASYMDNSYLVRTFLDNGYQVNLADHLDFIGHTGCNVLTENQDKKTIDDILLGNSIFNKLDQSEANYFDQVNNVMDVERSLWQYAQDMPTLSIGYLQMPHSPLAFTKDGEAKERKDYYAWGDDNNYIEQLQYTSNYMLELVDIILEHDPDALIIIQSDHGCRYPIHQIQCGNATDYDPETEYPYVQNILNCVYYRGETLDIEGLSGINTLRRTFNSVLGTGFEDLEPVYFWGNLSSTVTQFE